MKKFIWRKIVVPSLILASFILLIATFKNLSSSKEILNGKSREKLQIILTETGILNRKRIKKVDEVCQKYNLGIFRKSNSTSHFKYPPTPQYSVFYIDESHNIAYCPTYKAGSTTWIYNLLKLNGVKDDSLKHKQISEVARSIFPELDGEDAEIKLSQSKKLLCVRHPFERIISAYRDKLEDRNRAPEHGTIHYYKRWGARIRNKYRNTGKLEPSFEEFVRYLIETDLLHYADDHWIPYNAFCTPCHLRYDYITKVETMNNDQLFFMHSLGLPSWLKPSKRHSSSKISSEVAEEYFSKITMDQMNKLYEKFRLDFEMFNYSLFPYLQYVKN